MPQLINLNQIDFLTKLGCEEKTVDLLGTKFTFRTLSVEETSDSFEFPTKDKADDGIPRLNSLRIEILARSIVKINDLVIPDTFRERVKEKLKKMQQQALTKLFDAYRILEQKQLEVFEKAEKEIEQQIPAMAASSPSETHGKPQTTLQTEPILKTVDVPAEEAVNIINPQNLMGSRK